MVQAENYKIPEERLCRSFKNNHMITNLKYRAMTLYCIRIGEKFMDLKGTKILKPEQVLDYFRIRAITNKPERNYHFPALGRKCMTHRQVSLHNSTDIFTEVRDAENDVSVIAASRFISKHNKLCPITKFHLKPPTNN